MDLQAQMLKKAEALARKASVRIELAESDGKSIALPSASFNLVFPNLVYHKIADK